MADLKISQLTGATTPLAGTEVLPIDQSGTTKQVSVANLTAGRAVDTAALTASGLATFSIGATFGAGSFATNKIYTSAANGLLITGKTGSANDLSIVAPGGNIALAIPTNTEDIKINLGNIVQGTAAKGINFTANTAAAGMTSQLLNWYEEGTWTPTLVLGAGSVTYTSQNGRYTRIGRVVVFSMAIVVATATTPSSTMEIGGLPFTPTSTSLGAVAIQVTGATALATTTWMGNVESSAKFIRVYTYSAGNLANPGAYVQAGFAIQISGTYEV